MSIKFNNIYYFICFDVFFRKHILYACNSNDLRTKANGSSALVKFMMASASFCKEHLPVCFIIFELAYNIIKYFIHYFFYFSFYTALFKSS